MSGQWHQRTTLHTTHIQDLPSKVKVRRKRHPFDGKKLEVFSKIHRKGTLYLVVILPDGSKTMLPAEWTDYEEDHQEESSSSKKIIGTIDDLLQICRVVEPLLQKQKQNELEYASLFKEADHSTRVSNNGPGRAKSKALAKSRSKSKEGDIRCSRKTSCKGGGDEERKKGERK